MGERESDISSAGENKLIPYPNITPHNLRADPGRAGQGRAGLAQHTGDCQALTPDSVGWLVGSPRVTGLSLIINRRYYDIGGEEGRPKVYVIYEQRHECRGGSRWGREKRQRLGREEAIKTK